jgi:hypothetical protein
VNKKNYPWKAHIVGVRQIVSDGADAQQEKFELDIDLFRASRNSVIEGLVVGGIHAYGEAVTAAVPEISG